MVQLRYKEGDGDHTLFVKKQGDNVVILLVYVNDKEEIVRLKRKLSTEFNLNILGRLRYFLSIEIARSETEIL